MENKKALEKNLTRQECHGTFSAVSQSKMHQFE